MTSDVQLAGAKDAASPKLRVFEVEPNAGFERRYRRGDELCFSDVPRLTHLHVQRGWAFSYLPLEDGNRQIVHFHIPGDLICATAPITMGTNIVVEALCDVSVRPVALDAARCLKASQTNEARLGMWLMGIGHRTAYQRLAHLICELHARLSSVGQITSGFIKLPLFQEHFGQALGLTPVHVNRMFRRLKDEKIARAGMGRIEVFDLHRLRQVAGFDTRYLCSQPLTSVDAAVLS